METSQDLDVAWVFRSLHNIAAGLDQLHGIGIAHQDLKPSNVLIFTGQRSSKLADLGRAALKGQEPPHYGEAPAGDYSYAPPELLYDTPVGSWEQRRLACDAYHLGSMISSLFTTVAMTPLVLLGLPPHLHWSKWGGAYPEALAFLRPAFAEATEYVVREIPATYRGDVEPALRQLCEPDPTLRGHPRDRARVGSSFGLRRYVSLFDRLSRRAEYQLVRGE